MISLQITLDLNNVLKEWSRQAGCFTKEVPAEKREIVYMNALMELFSMFAKHHEELNNGDFIRAFRFFKDGGFTKRLSNETHVFNRFLKLENLEPEK